MQFKMCVWRERERESIRLRGAFAPFAPNPLGFQFQGCSSMLVATAIELWVPFIEGGQPIKHSTAAGFSRCLNHFYMKPHPLVIVEDCQVMSGVAEVRVGAGRVVQVMNSC